MGRDALRPIAVKFIDTSGTKMVLDFRSKEELDWFIHNEGDHIIEWRYI